jgi:hypothetical protein
MLVSFRGRTMYQVQKELHQVNKVIMDLKSKLNLQQHHKDSILEEINSFNVVKSVEDTSMRAFATEYDFTEFVKKQKKDSTNPEPFIDYEFPNENNCPHLFMK